MLFTYNQMSDYPDTLLLLSLRTGCVRGLEGEGMPYLRHHEIRGNLYVVFEVEFPENHFLDEDGIKVHWKEGGLHLRGQMLWHSGLLVLINCCMCVRGREGGRGPPSFQSHAALSLPGSVEQCGGKREREGQIMSALPCTESRYSQPSDTPHVVLCGGV